MKVVAGSSCSRLSSTSSTLRAREALGDGLGQRLLALLETENVRDRRSQERRVLNGCEVDEGRAVTELGRKLLGHGERQARLAGPARAGQRHEPDVVPAKERRNRCHLEVPSNERRRRSRQVPLGARLRLRRGERGIVLENRALELPQCGPWFDAELVQERAPSVPVGVERLLLPAGAVQGEDVLLPETFAIRMLGDQALELGQERVMATQCELGVVAELDGPEAQVLQPARLGLGDRFSGEVGEGRSMPELEGAPQILGGIGRAVPSSARRPRSTRRSNCSRSSSPGSVRTL